MVSYSVTPGTRAQAGLREWAALAVLALPALLISVDLFVMLMALPRLSANLHADSVQQLWMLDIYGFMVAGFLITMGTVGDRFGRRKAAARRGRGIWAPVLARWVRPRSCSRPASRSQSPACSSSPSRQVQRCWPPGSPSPVSGPGRW
jgi:hypothetical protein